MSSQHKDKADINVHIDSVVNKLKRRQISGSYTVAIETCQLLMRVISASRWNHPDQLIDIIAQVGKKLVQAQPREFSSGNIVRRVLSLIRDEMNDDNDVNNGNGGNNNNNNNSNYINNSVNNENQAMISSMFALLTTNENKKNTVSNQQNLQQQKSQVSSASAQLKKNTHTQDFRSIIIQGIKELIDEISSISENIETMSVDLIHDNEVLLTPTPGSKTVFNFLAKARLKRKFTVLVTECFPNETEEAHKFAKKLAAHKIDTVVIPDSTVFAVMSRVGKVIVGARSVFANGGCVTSSGVAAVCECAKEYKTPVFVVAGLYKLSPLYPFDRDSLVEVGNSGKVMEWEDSQLVGNCEVTNPLFDYVVPENIDIYITNVGGFSPSFIYRIVLDNYKAEDVNLE
ncbi:hypothetical protein PACTADRAFT_43645 [Pachysolen tannophilus NRRL Y-2460]|uniref:Translation initiation factor eIF2B subunit beta n=1 Tax=Pachysolen tannophilus NRRL Y-2460 TaxID=669874 RepID=A0A1E4TSQ4_PACTA|nr:hypothetical protein PACTADRAFT_43645 [Pachysolen tannophilus NRRL Y-2460]